MVRLATVLEDGPTHVGVAVARLLIAEGADWAYSTEVFVGRLVVLDQDAGCVAAPECLVTIVELLREGNATGPRYGGLPDVVGAMGTTIVMREVKRAKKDKIRDNQRAFVQAAASILADHGLGFDFAIVEWGE